MSALHKLACLYNLLMCCEVVDTKGLCAVPLHHLSDSCAGLMPALSRGCKPWRGRAGFYIMSSIHLVSRTRPAIYKPVEVAAFLGFFVWCVLACLSVSP